MSRTEAFGKAAARAVPAVALAAWSGAIIWLLDGDRYQAFLQPKLKPLLAAGALLSALFAASTLRARAHGVSSGLGRALLKGVMLVLPIAFLWAVYGESLGSHALSKRAHIIGRTPGIDSGTQQSSAQIPAAGTAAVSLLDLTDRASELLGRTVSVEGMVSRAGGLPGDWILLFRFRIVCCAADAVPVGVMARGKGLEALKEDAWVRIEGRFENADFEGETTPAVTAEKIEMLSPPPPEKRYLFK